jgi:ribosomal protein S18 acetylase RimI-like enzyme
MPTPAEPFVQFRPMTSEDLPAAHGLWAETPGVELAEGDRVDELEAYLRRNRDLSQVAFFGSQLIGAVLVGHDGRRGILYHLAVIEGHRGNGIGRKLVENGLIALKSEGVSRALLLVDRENENGSKFWKSMGWEPLSFAEAMGTDL